MATAIAAWPIPNSLAAVAAGADCAHGCALGIGERVGNAPMDQMLVNLKLMGVAPWADQDLSGLYAYCKAVSTAMGVPIPDNYPVVGRNAFRTATGVHAAAIIKAYSKNDRELADLVYSAAPAHYFGLEQTIEIGPMSGKSNVIYWLQSRGLEVSDELVARIFHCAETSDRLLKPAEILRICEDFKRHVKAA